MVRWAAGLRRAAGRQRAHAARLARAARHAGPGRLAGVVVDVEVGSGPGPEPGTVVVTGWAALPSRQVRAVVVTVDGTVAGVAAVGLDTPVGPDGSPVTPRDPRAGWVAGLDHGVVGGGRRRVGALALFDDGMAEELLARDVSLPAPPEPEPEPEPPVEEAPPPGHVDQPVAGAPFGPGSVVSGWYVPGAPFDRIEVRLGDRPPARARIVADPRPDVAGWHPDPLAPLAGWHLLAGLDLDLDLDGLDGLDGSEGDGDHREELVVEAVHDDGRRELGRVEVVVTPPPAPFEPDPARLAVLEARTRLACADHRPATDAVHLLVATHHLGLGGGQLYLQDLLLHLLAREDLACTVMSSVDGVLRDELEAAGATVQVVGPHPVDGLGYEARMAELARTAAGFGAGVVLANTAGSFWGVDLAARLGVPALWAVHESFPPGDFLRVAFGPGVAPSVERRFHAALAGAAAVVFEADATLALFEPSVGPGRALRVDYGVDLDRIAAHRARHRRDEVRAGLGFTDDDVVLLCMGTFEARKAQGALAAAFARVAPGHPEAVLALVGDNGTPYATALHQLVRRLARGDRIRVEPVTAAVDDWYAAADGFVLGSDVESLPRSMLEVMAHGVPVLGSAVFGVPELVVEGVTGLLFEPRSVGSVAAALDRFLALPADERRAMGARARDLVTGTRQRRFHGEAFSALIDALRDDPTCLPGPVLGR
ncbi:MAG: glycosyltransferase family 4 protein [Acidimicrobiia bacterium]